MQHIENDDDSSKYTVGIIKRGIIYSNKSYITVDTFQR